jgi:hypothetical protein
MQLTIANRQHNLASILPIERQQGRHVYYDTTLGRQTMLGPHEESVSNFCSWSIEIRWSEELCCKPACGHVWVFYLGTCRVANHQVGKDGIRVYFDLDGLQSLDKVWHAYKRDSQRPKRVRCQGVGQTASLNFKLIFYLVDLVLSCVQLLCLGFWLK